MSGIIAQNTLDNTGLIKAPEGGGAWTFIKKLTASSDSSLSFVDGTSDVVLDSTYKEYIFYFVNLHPASDANFTFNGSTDGGSNYNVTKTSTNFRAYHAESGSAAEVSYRTGADLAQSTSYEILDADGSVSTHSDSGFCGYLHLFNPADTTFVKHYISVTNGMVSGEASQTSNNYNAGYMNTTSAVDAIDFKFASGDIDAGSIFLHGLTI